jgi:hypothetical protein
MFKKLKPFLPLVVATIIITLVSTFHVISLFALSNNILVSIITAIAFETVAIGSLFAIFNSKTKNNSLWVIFITVAFFQVLGNSYYAFEFMSNQLITNPQFLDNWIVFIGQPIVDLINTFIGEVSDVMGFHKRLLSLLTGGMLPILYLASTHIIFKQIMKDEDDVIVQNKVDKIVEEIPTKVEEKDELDKVIEEIEKKEEVIPDNVFSSPTTSEIINGNIKQKKKGFLGWF